jgi:hypothetical protein
MVNNAQSHTSQNVFSNQSHRATNQKLMRALEQDKGRAKNARKASRQPAPQKKLMRPHPMNRDSTRSQNKATPKRKTVHLTLWVKPIIKAELQRIAERDGLSVSAAKPALTGTTPAHPTSGAYAVTSN